MGLVLETAARWKMDWTHWETRRGENPPGDGKDSHSFPRDAKFPPKQKPPIAAKPVAWGLRSGLAQRQKLGPVILRRGRGEEGGGIPAKG